MPDFDLAQYLAAAEVTHKPESPAAYTQEVVDLFLGQAEDTNPTMPWSKTWPKFRFRPKEVSLWSGVNGHGKSNMTSQVAVDLSMRQGERCAVLSLEMAPERTLYRMVRQAAGTAQPTLRYIKGFLVAMDQNLWIVPQQGTVRSPDDVIALCRYCSHELGVTQMFIDSLMKCISKEDDYNQQKSFVDQLCAVAKDTSQHIHLVHHIRKLEDEFKVPGKFDAKGSGSISDQVDNSLVVWRNKRKEVELRKKPNDPDWLAREDARLNVDKQRNGEWEGQIALWFDPGSMSYTGERGTRPPQIEINDAGAPAVKQETEYVDQW